MSNRRALARWFGANVSTALLYAALGYLAQTVTRGTGLASPIWPAAGLAFALLYQYGPRLVPGIALGSFVNNVVSLHRVDAAWMLVAFTALVIAFGAVAQAWAGRMLVSRFIGRHVSLVGPSQIISFLTISGPLACLVNSTLGTAAQVSAGFAPQSKSFLTWMTWWVGDSLGVILFGPIVLMLLSSNRETWRRRRLFVGVPALAAAIAGTAIFMQGAALEHRQRDLELQAVADQAARTLFTEMNRIAEVLHGVGGLYVASETVTAREFWAFTQDALKRDPSLQAISWNPWLGAADVAAFVQDQRANKGMNGYRLTERAPSGAFVPVAPRKRYLPVALIEPRDSNSRALGYDMASEPLRLQAIRRAIRTGAASATAPIDLVQEVGRQKGFLVLVPVFDSPLTPPTAALRAAHLRGFAVSVHRCADLLDVTFRDAAWKGVTLTLVDRTPGTAPAAMAERASRISGGAQPSHGGTVHFGGRVWQLEVAQVWPLAAPSQLVNAPIVMLLGLAMALLVMTFLLLVSGMEHQARADADLDPLTAVHNRRALMIRLETARRRSQLVGSTHVLLSLDLDGLKLVNDSAGHAVGDRVLQSFAEILVRMVRDQDTVARTGGDEFAVLLLDCGVERGLAIARNILTSVEELDLGTARNGFRVGVSIGLVAIAGADPQDVSDLLRDSDHACYAAKRAGGNAVLVFDPSMQMRA